MIKQYKQVIRIYFSGTFQWCLTATVLFVIALAAALAFLPANKFILILPLLFLIVLSASTPMFLLYFRAKKDLKENHIEKLTVKIAKIQEDNRHTLEYRGVPVGKQKYKIIDENGNEYFISSANKKTEWELFHVHLSITVEMDVLKTSGLVLNMKLKDIPYPYTPKKAEEQKQRLKAFEKQFCQYFY